MNILVIALAAFLIAIMWRFRPRSPAGKARRGVKRLNAQSTSLKREVQHNTTNFTALAAIDDPLAAAATLMVSIQSEQFVLGEGDEEIIAELLARLVDGEAVEQTLSYAKWAVLQGPGPDQIIDSLGDYLKQQLTRPEKVKFLELLDEADQKIGGCFDYRNSRQRLAIKMGLKVLH